MLLILNISFLTVLSAIVGFCEAEVDNSTIISRREIMEQQARTAYQNACNRLQELSNWMTAVFRIKSVWASATVNEIASRSEGLLTESDRKHKPGLPSRPKTASECSLSSVQVTAQTYAYLQSQLVMMKWLLGRNIFKSSKERLEGAKERMKMIESFNATLNDVVSKLKLSTVNTSSHVDSEAWRAGNIGTGRSFQEGRFLHLLQNPKAFLMNILEDQIIINRSRDHIEPKNFFQNLGRNLDKFIFSIAPVKQNIGTGHPAVNDEPSVTNAEPPVANAELSLANAEPSVANAEPSVANAEPSVANAEPPVANAEPPVANAVPYMAKLSTPNTVMFSSIL